MRPLALAPLFLLALSGCMTAEERSQAAADEAAAARLDASGQRYGDGAVKAGEAKDCIESSRIRSTDVLGDRVIDFEMTNGVVYRNVMPYGCASLGFEERFAYETTVSQLCSIDTITVLNAPGLTTGPTCGLGQFQPIETASR